MTQDTAGTVTHIAGSIPETLMAGLSSRPIIIQNVTPVVDDGRYPIKREVGDVLEIGADIFREGHDKLTAVMLYRRLDQRTWHEAAMTCINPGLDRWTGAVELTENTTYVYTIEAWVDLYESWVDEVRKKLADGQKVPVELVEGQNFVAAAGRRAGGADASRLAELLKEAQAGDDERKAAVLLGDEARALVGRYPDRGEAVRYDRELRVIVDRVAARYAAWYEMFHRSQGTVPGKSATFADCERRLPEVRAMGFDVIYFVPIHPIGRAFRKGPNNTLNAGPDDPGSPYAIGGAEGGHKAVHPDLGTLADFRRFVRACHAQGMEVALDFAIQCAPDHPWIKEETATGTRPGGRGVRRGRGRRAPGGGAASR